MAASSFFVTSKYVQFAGLLNNSETITALLKILAGFGVLFFLIFFLIKNYSKAGVIATYLGSIYLFFGDVKRLLTQIPVLHYISSYRIFLPLLFILSVLLIYKIRKWKQLTRTTLFLNVLLLLYIGIEAYKWIQVQQKGSFVLKNSAVGNNLSLPIIASSEFTNIYYIVLDCYPSATYQDEILGVKDHLLDSSLTFKGFFVLKHPRSNYTKTAFSLAATFDMNYLPWLDTILIPPYEYNRAMALVKNSPVFALLNKGGYQIHNLSIFDLPGKPSIQKGKFLSTNTTQMIFFNTLWNSFNREVM